MHSCFFCFFLYGSEWDESHASFTACVHGLPEMMRCDIRRSIHLLLCVLPPPAPSVPSKLFFLLDRCRFEAQLDRFSPPSIYRPWPSRCTLSAFHPQAPALTSSSGGQGGGTVSLCLCWYITDERTYRLDRRLASKLTLLWQKKKKNPQFSQRSQHIKDRRGTEDFFFFLSHFSFSKGLFYHSVALTRSLGLI